MKSSCLWGKQKLLQGWWEFTAESSGEKAGGEEEAKQEEKQLVNCFH